MNETNEFTEIMEKIIQDCETDEVFKTLLVAFVAIGLAHAIARTIADKTR